MPEKNVQLNEEVSKGQIQKLARGSVGEALIEIYPAGVLRRAEDITKALWGSKASPSAIRALDQKACSHIEDWRSHPSAASWAWPERCEIVSRRSVAWYAGGRG